MAYAINATPIPTTSGKLKAATEKPSISSFVKNGTTNPASVVNTLAIKPIVNAIFGNFVETMSFIKDYKLLFF